MMRTSEMGVTNLTHSLMLRFNCLDMKKLIKKLCGICNLELFLPLSDTNELRSKNLHSDYMCVGHKAVKLPFQYLCWLHDWHINCLIILRACICGLLQVVTHTTTWLYVNILDFWHCTTCCLLMCPMPKHFTCCNAANQYTSYLTRFLWLSIMHTDFMTTSKMLYTNSHSSFIEIFHG